MVHPMQYPELAIPVRRLKYFCILYTDLNIRVTLQEEAGDLELCYLR